MDIGALINDLNLQRHVLAAVLGLPRLSVLIFMAPFLGGNIVTGQLKISVIFALYCLMFPLILHQMPAEVGLTRGDVLLYAGLGLKEVFLGFLLAYVSGIVFWTAQSAGFIMDNQRGASMAAGPDPLSGEETSPLGSFFFQCLVYLFFAGGAFLAYLGLVFQTYAFWPVYSWWPNLFSAAAPLFFIGLVVWLMLQMLLLSGPVVAAALLTDISLGVINRFASQLNVYVLAMPIKSGLAMLIILLYITVFVNLSPALFDFIHQSFERLRVAWP